LCMGVTATVKALAETVAHAKGVVLPRHHLSVELLRLMPLYAEIDDLTSWDEAYRGVLTEADDDSEVGKLLNRIFDFACTCFYGAFDAAAYLRDYEQLSEVFHASGISLAKSPDLSDW